MLRIRFFRVGKKNQPFFKIIVTDKRRPPRGGRFVEEVGFYNPLTKEKNLKIERIKHWLSKGAKPSDTVYNLLIKEAILEGKKIPLHKKKKEKPVAEAPAGEKEKPTETPSEKPEGQKKPGVSPKPASVSLSGTTAGKEVEKPKEETPEKKEEPEKKEVASKKEQPEGTEQEKEQKEVSEEKSKIQEEPKTEEKPQTKEIKKE